MVKRLEVFALDAADVRRIDEIVTALTGQGLAAEVARWHARRRRQWIALALVLVLAAIAAADLAAYRW
jgi:hypothetical protein